MFDVLYLSLTSMTRTPEEINIGDFCVDIPSPIQPADGVGGMNRDTICTFVYSYSHRGTYPSNQEFMKLSYYERLGSHSVSSWVATGKYDLLGEDKNARETGCFLSVSDARGLKF
jgi:hypothetical protein